MGSPKKATRLEYDGMASRYDLEERSEESIYPFRKYINFREMKALGLLGEVYGRRVLDVGTGTARFALEIAARRGDVVGIELSEGMIREAKKKAKFGVSSNLALVVGDAENLPFISKCFDMLTSITTINHLPDPERAMEETSRVLKDGGTAIVSAPNLVSARALPWICRKVKEWLSRARMKRMCASKFPFWRLYSMHRKVGLKIICTKGVIWAPLWPRKNYPDWVIEIVRFSEEVLDKIPWLANLAGTIVVKSTK